MNKFKGVIFDVGGVLFLVKDKKKRNQKNLLSSFKETCKLIKEIDIKKDYESLKEIYFKSTRHEISKKETSSQVSKILGISPEKSKQIFDNTYRKNTVENKKLYSCIQRLKRKGYKIAISSIQSYLSLDILIPKKYHKTFDILQISCSDGLRKPDSKSFEFVFNKLKLNPEELVFIDDKEENLISAKKLGIKTILFKNNKQLFQQLSELGIK